MRAVWYFIIPHRHSKTLVSPPATALIAVAEAAGAHLELSTPQLAIPTPTQPVETVD